jgi:hypothetical protein
LKLRDYQAQTLTWLHQVESDNNAERALAFTCPEFISSRDLDKDDIEDVDIPPWIRIGMEIRGYPIFYSLSEFTNHDEKRKVYQLPSSCERGCAV